MPNFSPLSPIALVLIGFYLSAFGGLWFLVALLGQKKTGWRTPLILSGLLAGTSVALLAYDALVAGVTGMTALFSLGCSVLRTDFPGQLARLLARPIIQGLGIGILGLGVVVYGIYRIDADLQDDIDQSNKELIAFSSGVGVNSTSSMTLHTDAGRDIPLWTLAEQEEESQTFTETEYLRRLRLDTFVIQTGPKDGDYNCHGWVFTGGKYWVLGRSVDTILMDNGYRETKSPMIGDLCIYRDQDGNPAHTAIVRGLGDKGMILLESKWGKLGRYIHQATSHHVYMGMTPMYYRTQRTTHLLSGSDAIKPQHTSITE